MADPRGTVEQAAQAAVGMFDPVDYVGTQLSVASEHHELMGLMGMLSGINVGGGAGGAYDSDAVGAGGSTGASAGSLSMAFGMCNPHLPGCPLTHASLSFLQLTGYTKAKAIGSDISELLAGPKTDGAAMKTIRRAMTVQRGGSASDPAGLTTKILCEREDGTEWWNVLHLAPVLDHDGNLARWVVCVTDVTEDVTEEDELDNLIDSIVPESDLGEPLRRVHSADDGNSSAWNATTSGDFVTVGSVGIDSAMGLGGLGSDRPTGLLKSRSVDSDVQLDAEMKMVAKAVQKQYLQVR